MLSLIQIVMALWYRLSPAGRICSGDKLYPGELESMMYRSDSFYLLSEGRLLYVIPIVQMSVKPVLCCLLVFVTQPLVSKIQEDRQLMLVNESFDDFHDMITPQ